MNIGLPKIIYIVLLLIHVYKKNHSVFQVKKLIFIVPSSVLSAFHGICISILIVALQIDLPR